MSVGDRLFHRVARVTCWRETVPADPTQFSVSRLPNATEITGLRIQFKVVRDLSKHPNTCDITITNLAESTRHDLETKPLLVQLEAGYDGVPRLLFAGDLRFGMTELKGPNWETLLQLGDGDCHHRWSRVSKTYGPGTRVRTVLADAVRSYGMDLPQALAADPALDEQFENGHVMHGPARDELTKLLARYGYHYSNQNGKLVVLRDNEVSSTDAIPIDEEHGMIGTPEFGSPPKSGKPPHVTVHNLLYPEMSPGALVKLTSRVKSGFFRVEKVTHHGDTHGKPWETALEIKPVPVPVPAGKGTAPVTKPLVASEVSGAATWLGTKVRSGIQ